MSDMANIWSQETIIRLLQDLIAKLFQGQYAQAAQHRFDSLERVEIANEIADFFDVRSSGLEDLLLTKSDLEGWAEIVMRSRQHNNTYLNFKTSGSISEPKIVQVEMSALIREAHFLATLFGTRRRIVSLVPSQHIYGFLTTVLLPHILGISVIDQRKRLPKAVCEELKPGDLLVGHPFILNSVFASGCTVENDVEVVTSTAPSSKELWESIHKAHISKTTELYGSSETGGIASRNAFDDPFGLFDYLVKTEDQRIQDKTGVLLDLQDDLVWQDDTHFKILKRKDHAVQVGGHNVYPGEIEKILNTHPSVKNSSVRLMSKYEGKRLKAFIALSHSTKPNDLQAELEELVTQHFTAPSHPKSYTFGTELPTDTNGKRTNWEISR